MISRAVLRSLVAVLTVCCLTGLVVLRQPFQLSQLSHFDAASSTGLERMRDYTNLGLQRIQGLLNGGCLRSDLAVELAHLDRLLAGYVAVPEQGYSHYTEVAEDDWPIDLNQYKGRHVFRLRYGNLKTQELLMMTILELNMNIWATAVTQNFVDVESDEESIRVLLQQFYGKHPISETPQLQLEFLIGDLAQTVYESYPAEMDVSEDVGSSVDLFFRKYRDLHTIYSWFDLLVETYPDILELVWIGQTFEGRDLKALRVSSHKEGSEDVKTIVITAGVHAREWISTSSACYIIYKLIEDYESGGRDAHYYLDNLDFLFIPVTNPDGYEYSWHSDRLWRKNRQETYHPRCWGIDIDHSFDFHFQKSDDLPCGEDYSGEEAFESLESRIINQYLNETKHQHSIHGYIDLHSYAQEVLYPYAFSCSQMPRDEENLLELAYGLSKAIRLSSGKSYGVLSACQDKGADFLPALGSGSALDYMYHNRAYWAFQLKLRDSGNHGFLLPSRYIGPVGEEIYSAIKYFSAFVLNPEG
ncbi:unnamed protein product [Kuraishia capsulata CBS 1993]|uniref:Inactive metallocarboxypeptidase ECM14 n=1 Tax=Kuraishia capsulata CBS 1993 TaxID=1382522 RepID=W6ML06_9ASCO|nr:uncharacterized protein KUCA_T00003088001 [Kuraishia capsulata CBS 1993]CDK27111.1 unnamed protein product [Kuraishia capsulata CBS 1993]